MGGLCCVVEGRKPPIVFSGCTTFLLIHTLPRQKASVLIAPSPQRLIFNIPNIFLSHHESIQPVLSENWSRQQFVISKTLLGAKGHFEFLPWSNCDPHQCNIRAAPMLVNSSIRCPPRRFSRDAIARFTPLTLSPPPTPWQSN